MDAVKKNQFLSRLQSLQRLCVQGEDQISPNAVLLVLGQDGRYNKGSSTALKYLYKGAVSKDLFEETIDFEPLEEMIMLIKPDSVSVLWTHAVREYLLPVFCQAPVLVEYITCRGEEEDIDLLQARKCCDFKRMMLAAVRPGESVGIPVPIGYENILDVEGWPILQAFALDSVYCQTGFFTARYNIEDVSEQLEILYRTVDSCYVDHAINTLRKTVRPHLLQSISMLDASVAYQRMQITAGDAIGPLAVMFEFGEMELAGGRQKCDPTMTPIALFGKDTAEFASAALASSTPSSSSSGGGTYFRGWEDRAAGSSLHVVMEGCEPSTGLRFCRTYFLRRGKSLSGMLPESDFSQTPSSSSAYAASGHSSAAAVSEAEVTGMEARVLQRLESLYVKAWISLRHVARRAFSEHHDVLEAGSSIQRAMDIILRKHLSSHTSSGRRQEGKRDDSKDNSHEDTETETGLESIDFESMYGLRLSEVALLACERLQVHVDCLNAIGEVVSIDDVDDMGGACWVYVRVSIHDIPLGGPHYFLPASSSMGAHSRAGAAGAGITDMGCVAVGDTFLFSPLALFNSVDAVFCGDMDAAHAVPATWSELSAATSTGMRRGRDSAGGSGGGGGDGAGFVGLMSDGFCVTHSLPYYRALIGPGEEERSAQRIASLVKSPLLLAQLGLGKQMDHSYFATRSGFVGASSSAGSSSIVSASASASAASSSGAALTIPILTDHPLVPLTQGNVRIFTEGLIVDKLMNVSSLPIVISIRHHVECMWTLNASDFVQHALFSTATSQHLRAASVRATPNTASGRVAQREKEEKEEEEEDRQLTDLIDLPQGLVLVFRLKNFVEEEDGAEEGEEERGKRREKDSDERGLGEGGDESERFFRHNPLQRALPGARNCLTLSAPRYIALFVQEQVGGSGAGIGSLSSFSGGAGSFSAGSSSVLTAASAAWHVALRMYDVPHFRGFPSASGASGLSASGGVGTHLSDVALGEAGSVVSAFAVGSGIGGGSSNNSGFVGGNNVVDAELPQELLWSIVKAIDSWNDIASDSAVVGRDAAAESAMSLQLKGGLNGRGGGIESDMEISSRMLMKLASIGSARGGQSLPGLGLQLIRCMHSLSTMRKTGKLDFQRLMQSSVPPPTEPGSSAMLVLAGLGGSAVGMVAVNLQAQLRSALLRSSSPTSSSRSAPVHVHIDLSSWEAAAAVSGRGAAEGGVAGIALEDIIGDIVQQQQQGRSTVPKGKGIGAYGVGNGDGQTDCCLVVSIVLSPSMDAQLSEVVQAVELVLSSRAVAVVPVLSPVSAVARTELMPSAVREVSERARGYAHKAYASSLHGVGQEEWYARNFSCLQTASCDIAIALVDLPSSSSSFSSSATLRRGGGNKGATPSSTTTASASAAAAAVVAAEDAYALFRDVLERVNPTAQIVRLSANNPRVDEETAEALLAHIINASITTINNNSSSSTEIGSGVHYSARECALLATGCAPTRLLRAQYSDADGDRASGSALAVSLFSHEAPAGSSAYSAVSTCVLSPHCASSEGSTELGSMAAPTAEKWNLSLFVKCLQLLFPMAKLSASSSAAVASSEVWRPPTNTRGSTGLKRAIELAQAKVLTSIQCREGSALFAQRLAEKFPGVASPPSTHTASSAERENGVDRGKGNDQGKVWGGQEGGRRLQAIIESGILSVHGFLCVDGGITLASSSPSASHSSSLSSGAAVASTAAAVYAVEACAGHIIIRQIECTSSSFKEGRYPMTGFYGRGKMDSESHAGAEAEGGAVVVTGSLSDQDQLLLSELFAMCVQHRLQRKPLLTSSADLSREDKLRVQRMEKYQDFRSFNHSFREISEADSRSSGEDRAGGGRGVGGGSWWFDGHSYTDIHGNRSELRPDIEALLEVYLRDENEKIRAFNAMLDRIVA